MQRGKERREEGVAKGLKVEEVEEVRAT